jgi:hypothetical protein
MSSKQPSKSAKLLANQARHPHHRRVTDDPLAPAPQIMNALPDVEGDDQQNVISRDVQLAGLQLSIARWFPLADPDEEDTVYIYAGNTMIGFYVYDGDDPEPPDPVEISLASVAALRSHGSKEITYKIEHPSGNTSLSEIMTVFVDTIDPNYNNQPPAITLPTDLTGDITPAYLADKLGLVCSIPRMDDARPGDTWQAFFGDADETGISGEFPDTGNASVTFTTANIMAAGPGDYAIRYIATDRAGNSSKFSFPRTVTVNVNEPPILGTLSVLEAPLVDKEEARNGVTVRLSSITNVLSVDVVRVFWSDTLVAEQSVGGFPIFPFDFPVGYDQIALPGDLYTANIECSVSRAETPATTTVDVDLVEPGTGNPGPGPVDDRLIRPIVRGGVEMRDNQVVEEDRNEPAIASFTIPDNLVSGDFIDIFYGSMGGTQGDTYPVTGTEAPDFLVELEIAWSIIELYGNGDIPCYYRIRNAINYKHSPSQNVAVSTYSLDGLADAQFTVTSSRGTLNCEAGLSPRPWEGVPVFIKDTATLEVGDMVTVHAARYAFLDPSVPVGDPIESLAREVTFNDVQNGFTVTLDLGEWFRAHTASGGRGWVGVNWSIFRPSTGDRGTSDVVQVQWDFRISAPPVNSCVPDATRAGTL